MQQVQTVKKYFIFVILFSLFFSSCAHHSGVVESEKPGALFNTMTFVSSTEALAYAMDRRLQIQRLYENSSEPYFGKPEEKNCRENVGLEGKIQQVNGGSFFSLQILVNDNFAIGDCLLENNSQKALYEFLICNNIVYEYRSFFKLQENWPKVSPRKCPRRD